MKKAAILMLVLMILMAGLAGWLFTQCYVKVVSSNAVVMEMPQDVYEELRKQVEEDCLEGILFRRRELGKADDYQLCTYTIRISNQTFLTADMIEAQITPVDSDVLQLMNTSVAFALPARSEGDLTVTVMTAKGTQPAR